MADDSSNMLVAGFHRLLQKRAGAGGKVTAAFSLWLCNFLERYTNEYGRALIADGKCHHPSCRNSASKPVCHLADSFLRGLTHALFAAFGSGVIKAILWMATRRIPFRQRSGGLKQYARDHRIPGDGRLRVYACFARESACSMKTHALAAEPDFACHLGGSNADLLAQFAQGDAKFIRGIRVNSGTVLTYPKNRFGLIGSLENTGSVVKKNFPKNLLVTQEPECAINGCPANRWLTATGQRMKFFSGKDPGGGQRRLNDGAAHRALSDKSLKLR